MGLHKEHGVEIHWSSHPSGSLRHPEVVYSLGANRFEEIDRFFHVNKPQLDEDEYETAWKKGEPLSFVLQALFTQATTHGTHLAVDEAIARQIGRFWDLGTVPNKPTTTGYKIWVLASEDYVLNWLYQTKKKSFGPIDLDPEFTRKVAKEKGRLATKYAGCCSYIVETFSAIWE